MSDSASHRMSLGRGGASASRYSTLVLLLLGSAAIGSLIAGTPAQSAPDQEPPTIEPRFTRVFGSDTLSMYQLAISPDGRWIVFSQWEGSRSGRQNLWILRADGGDAVRLTEGDYWDARALWFPAGDKIAFRSSRVDGNVMTLPIDPATGRPQGPPRQVTFNCDAWFDISPDGKWIAYVSWVSGESSRRLEVVPASGGAARIVAQDDMSIAWWGPDGESLYYPVSRLDRMEALMRVPAQGGQPDTVMTWPGQVFVFVEGGDAFVLRKLASGPGQQERYDVATLAGESLARFELPRGMRVRGEGLRREILATMGGGVAPLKVLPLDGGAARRLTESTSRAQPLGWTSDGAVLFATELDGYDAFLLASISGGPMREVKLPEEHLDTYGLDLSAGGRYVSYAVTGPDETFLLKAMDIESGESWVLSDSLVVARWGVSLVGRGGTRGLDGRDFLFLEKRGDRYELRAAPPRGPSRLLWSFARDELPGNLGVHGDRIVWGGGPSRDDPGGPGGFYLATAGDGEPQHVAIPGGPFAEPTWSHDGRWIAAFAWPDAPEAGQDLALIEISAEGRVVGEPRILDAGAVWWWGTRWLPDDRGVLLVGQSTMTDADIWLVSLDVDSAPARLTRDETYPMWVYILSPDGKHIAYALDIPRGNSIWRVDLSDAFKQ